MKKIYILIVIVAMSAVTVNAQRWFIDGTVRVNFNKNHGALLYGEEKTTSIVIAPSINRMISEKWAVGLGLVYSYSKTSAQNSNTRTNIFGIAPSLTYFGKLSDKFFYTPALSVGGGFGKSKTSGVGYDNSDITTLGAIVTPFSFEFRPIPSLGINLSAGELGYVYTKIGDVKNDNFNFSLNDAFRFAVRVYF